MKAQKFIPYEKIVEILEKNSFHGFTAKRVDNHKVVYTFISIKWINTKITVDTLKIDTNKKITLGIKINDQQLNTYKDFICYMKNLYPIYLKNKKQNAEKN